MVARTSGERGEHKVNGRNLHRQVNPRHSMTSKQGITRCAQRNQRSHDTRQYSRDNRSPSVNPYLNLMRKASSQIAGAAILMSKLEHTQVPSHCCISIRSPLTPRSARFFVVVHQFPRANPSIHEHLCFRMPMFHLTLQHGQRGYGVVS